MVGMGAALEGVVAAQDADIGPDPAAQLVGALEEELAAVGEKLGRRFEFRRRLGARLVVGAPAAGEQSVVKCRVSLQRRVDDDAGFDGLVLAGDDGPRLVGRKGGGGPSERR